MKPPARNHPSCYDDFPIHSCNKETIMAEVGKAAPEFKLKAHDGSEVSLSQFRGSKWAVISSYPLAFTGG